VRRDWLLITLFGLTLVCLGAMVVWWTILINGAVSFEHQVTKSELSVSSYQLAAVLGGEPSEPILAEGLTDTLELVQCADDNLSDKIQLLPLHPDICIQPSGSTLADIQDRLARRHSMVMGEGVFLFGLLAMCCFMLYYLVAQKQRHAARMELFFHAATHEMKTPLTGIKTLLETLRARRVPEAERDNLLDLGLEGCHRLERRIENVLIAGGLRAGGKLVHVTSIDLIPLIGKYIDQRAHTLAGRPENIRLIEANTEALYVLADKDLLLVILNNLIDNGLKYGGPLPQVEIKVVSQDGTVQISVSDTGVGFDPKQADALFTPYRRAFNEGHTIKYGTGLGLSIARNLCEQMGGALMAHSDGLDCGATFTVTLRKTGKESRS